MTSFTEEVQKLQEDLYKCYKLLSEADIGLPDQRNFDNLPNTIEKCYLSKVSFTPTLSPVSTTFTLINSTTNRENVPVSGVYKLNGDSTTNYNWIAEADGYITQTGTITGVTETLRVILELSS